MSTHATIEYMCKCRIIQQ